MCIPKRNNEYSVFCGYNYHLFVHYLYEFLDSSTVILIAYPYDKLVGYVLSVVSEVVGVFVF